MDVKWAPGAFERFEAQFGKVIDAFSKTNFGTTIVTKDGIFFIDPSRQQFQWDRYSWSSNAWWDEYGMPNTDCDAIFKKAKAFAKLAHELIIRDVRYLNHPVIAAWIKYNQDVIIFVRSVGNKFNHPAIRDAEDHLREVGGGAAADGAKRIVKSKDELAYERKQELTDKVKPLHEAWWKLRTLKKEERRRILCENPYEDVIITPDEPGPREAVAVFAGQFEEELEEWDIPWLDIFESTECLERNRKYVHLQQAVRVYMERNFPGLPLENVRRGHRRKRLAASKPH